MEFEVSEEHGLEAPEVDAVEPTGHPDVDGVIASLDGLDETPVAERVPVFESAHETLRAALADAGNEPT
jgi:hypothetical protein